ncbi:hypothetical protein [Undibacterium sp. Ji49W]|uniref:hypothetical protein n=1 Tax=Undibacterium sp. Ji49W TaxID=3413040 RepID=UPI003BEF8CA1
MNSSLKPAVLLCAAIALASSPSVYAADKPAAPSDLALSCQNPVKKGDTAQGLKKRYPGNASVQEVDGAEGSTQKVLVLYPQNLMKPYRVEVYFDDDAMTRLVSVNINIEKSQWTYQGLKTLDSIQAVEKQNGKPFTLYGFGWDYGGHVTSFNDGAFSKPSGDCTPHFRFQLPPGKNTPKAILGEQKIKSNLPAVIQAQPYLSEISLDFVEQK